MAIGDWTIFKSDPAMTVALTSTSAIVGATSLVANAVGAPACSFNMHRVSAAQRGFVRGQVEFLVRPTAQSSGGMFGFYCMSDQLDMTTTGNCYGMYYRFSSSAGFTQFIIGKSSSGVDDLPLSSGTKFYTESFQIPNGSVMPFRFRWNADENEFNGVQFTLHRGVLGQTDYVGLTQVFTGVDSSSPLLTTVGEGPCGDLPGGNADMLMDNYLGYELQAA